MIDPDSVVGMILEFLKFGIKSGSCKYGIQKGIPSMETCEKVNFQFCRFPGKRDAVQNNHCCDMCKKYKFGFKAFMQGFEVLFLFIAILFLFYLAYIGIPSGIMAVASLAVLGVAFWISITM